MNIIFSEYTVNIHIKLKLLFKKLKYNKFLYFNIKNMSLELVFSFTLNEIEINSKTNELSIYVDGTIISSNNENDLKRKVYEKASDAILPFIDQTNPEIVIKQRGDTWLEFDVYCKK